MAFLLSLDMKSLKQVTSANSCYLHSSYLGHGLIFSYYYIIVAELVEEGSNRCQWNHCILWGRHNDKNGSLFRCHYRNGKNVHYVICKYNYFVQSLSAHFKAMGRMNSFTLIFPVFSPFCHQWPSMATGSLCEIMIISYWTAKVWKLTQNSTSNISSQILKFISEALTHYL